MPLPRRFESSPKQELESWIEEVIDDKNGSRNTAKQIVVGGVSGWVTGLVCMKVGKVAATAIGGGIILLQVANQYGYINLNWNRINRDFERISDKIQKEALGKKKDDWADKLEKKAMKIVDRQRGWFRSMMYTEEDQVREFHLFITSFTAGIGLGLIMGCK